MTPEKIMQIFRDTAYVRTGGSAEELRCAEYLMARVAELGADAHLEPFAVDMATIKTAILEADGEEIPCLGYLNAGTHTVEAPFFYLRSSDRLSLAACRGKIVLIDGYLGYWRYRELLENGAVGFISFSGHVNYADCEIDRRELRSYVSKGEKIPGMNINAKSAAAMVERGVKTVKITLEQDEYVGESHNVVVDLPGESDDMIIFSAHYDSTSLSQGAYDNMSGCVGLLGLIEYFRAHPHRCSLRFVFCGSEERGLLGAKAYCAAHEDELEKMVLNINLDMIGCTMGHLIAKCTTEEALVHYISYLGCEKGVSIAPKQGVHSSDSTPFADRGIPAVSFARYAPSNTATIHNSYDTIAVMRGEQMVEDIDFVIAFADRMANAVICPVKREIPDKVRDELDRYLLRKK
ncbi:MAG: Zn-dependent exopeptidase M28 [Clostridia bacterium]|nr:Zn-dependent exopeptidase M28 [Clostridia bacterium]